ncbi:MAG: bifunctional pyr operon transcriptional regulator/uracil phosphoribosyltransferase PyrR [Lachnospiraceae bacterium]|nr:bifunctional pyr operon transcriptional regulator/uracil phosphoribosyltransferase PyrR [Lachnospiraceae bacterium]
MQVKAVLMDEASIKRSVMRITHEIIERYKGVSNVCVLGIKRRGIPLAEMIKNNIEMVEGTVVPTGTIDITLYRDDLTEVTGNPVVSEPSLSFDITGKDVVLVDDVIYTGRTARAALEAVFSVGRPHSVSLAVLVDRGHRELPIRADFVGKNIPTSKSEIIAVHMPAYDGCLEVLLCE